MSNWRHRQRLLVQQGLEAAGSLRVTFFFMLLWTGIIAFLASLLLRHAGVTHMGWRYALVVVIAYGVFLLLLWLWLRTRSDPSDGPDLSGLHPGHDGAASAPELPPLQPGGGGFGGGGASGDIDVSGAGESVLSAKAETAGGLAVAAGEGCGVVILAGLALAAVLTWVLSVAPVLLAEIVLDSCLLAALYRRWRRSDEPYRLMAAWRHTRYPFVLVLVLVGALGTLLQWYAPEATTLGAVWQHSK